jgi:hypothetical protein
MNYKYLRYGFFLIVTIVLFLYLRGNYEDFSILKRLNTSNILTLYLSYLALLLVNCYQSYVVIGDSNIKKSSFLKFYILARFLSKLIPQSGNIYMGQMLKDEFNLKYSKYIERLLSLYVMDTSFIFLFFVATTLIIDNNLLGFQAFEIDYLIVMIGLFTTSIFVVFLYIKISRYKNKWLDKILDILFNIMMLLKNPYMILKVFFYSALSFSVVSSIFYQILAGLSIEVNWSFAVIFAILFRISHLINITPGNIGVSELLLGYIADILGIGFSNGVIISVTYRVIVYSSIISYGLLLGGWSLIKNKHKKQHTHSIIK